MKNLITIGMAALLLPITAAELVLHGRLAQSQAEGTAPITGCAATICEIPGSGDCLMFSGSELWKITAGKAEKISSGHRKSGTFRQDGKNIYLVANHNEVYPLIRKNGKWTFQKLIYLKVPKQTSQAFTVADASADADGKAKFFTLVRKTREVHGFDAKGKYLGVVMTLPDLSAVNKKYCSFWNIIKVPGSGDLIACSYYPDRAAYRFKADGTEITANGWPIRNKGIWAGTGCIAGGKVWGLGSGAWLFPDDVSDRKDMIQIDPSRPANSMASAGNGSWYIGSGTGVRLYESGNLTRPVKRFGGTGQINALALNDGSICAGMKNGPLYGLNLDDPADGPLQSSENESWRVGLNWSSSCDLMTASGNGFAIWDGKKSTVWQFVPSKTGKGRWTKRKESFRNLTAFCAAGDTIEGAENGQYKSLSGVISMSAGNDLIYAANTDTVTAFSGKGEASWTQKLPKIVSIAAAGKFLAVSTGTELVLLNGADGKILARTPSEVTLLAAEGKWIIGYAPAGAVLLRYKIK